MVVTHFQLTTNIHSKPDAQPIAEKNIKYYSIPPAFSKVREQMSKCNLE